MEDVTNRITEIIYEKILVDKDKIVPAASFDDDLGIDSLDKAEIMEAIEKEFNAPFHEEHFEKLKTVGQVIDYIEQHAKHQES
jgi:acyl carrier protein